MSGDFQGREKRKHWNKGERGNNGSRKVKCSRGGIYRVEEGMQGGLTNTNAGLF